MSDEELLQDADDLLTESFKKRDDPIMQSIAASLLVIARNSNPLRHSPKPESQVIKLNPVDNPEYFADVKYPGSPQ